jgi:peptidoglycan/LPS O-acetylase OafA/YrhL
MYYFAQLPLIRTFFTGGHFAVSVFFIISGYVLSAKPLSLIYSGEHAKLGDNLSSALFRRWLRLHIPVFVVTFAYMTSWHAFGIWTVSPEHEANYRDEVWKFYREFKNFSFAFRTGGEDWFTYNFPTWSIPVEFRGSIIVYTSLLAFSRCTRNARLLGQLLLIFYFMYIVDGWFGSMFVAGTCFYLMSAFLREMQFPCRGHNSLL